MKNINSRSEHELKRAFIILIVLLVFLFVLGVAYYFTQTHFLWGTTIEDVSCSFLSVEKAIQKINLEKESKIVTFCFSNGNTYNVEARYLGVHVDENRVAEIFEQQQLNPKESKKYDLNEFILVDSNKLRTFLEQIPELQKENMIEPQNAYIIWDEIEFTIQKEELGNVIDFEEAMNFSMEQVKCDEEKIDFSFITHITPEILAEDLVSEQRELNSILNSSINYELSDGSIVTLDSNIIKNWVYQDENDIFKFDIENGVSQFVEELAIKVDDANSFMQFTATDCEELVTVNLPWEVRSQLDKNSEIDAIKLLLGKTEKIYKNPIYDRVPIYEKLFSYVEIDISRQHIWFYKNGILIMDTPCVTGNVRNGHSTPTGVFFLKNKNRKVYLEGYNDDGSKYSSFVEYWMRFNQGIGMHDASWRYNFGGNIYLTGGSHGCVNMPKDAAAITYENIDETMPIIVYQSKI